MICLKERIGRKDAEEAAQLAAQSNVSQLAVERNVCAHAHGTTAAAENVPPGADCNTDRAAARPSCITARAARGADIGSRASDTAEVVVGHQRQSHQHAMQSVGQEQGNSLRPLRELPWREVCDFLRALDIDEPGGTRTLALCVSRGVRVPDV